MAPHRTAGIFQLKDEEYFADPAPQPSLTQSLVKLMLARSPRHVWHAHPRLNPDYRDTYEEKYSIGSAAHAILLGKGRQFKIIDAPDWRTKAAKEERDKAVSAGKLPVLAEAYNRAREMAHSAFIQLADCGVDRREFEKNDSGRMSEATLMAPYKLNGSSLWLRTKIDRLCPKYIFDYKTTKQAATSDVVERRIVTDGWDIQAAMHRILLDILQPMYSERRYIFLLQEAYPPFALRAIQLPEAALAIGKEKIVAAAEIWVECLRTKHWPSYQRELAPIAYPEWAAAEWRAKRMIGQFIEEGVPF